MPGYREPTPEELEESRDVRVARQQLDRLEISVHYLDQASRLRADGNQPADPRFQQFLRQSREGCLALQQKLSGRVQSRRRPHNRSATETCTIYVDECGQHVVTAKDPFPVFVLAAAIVRDADYPVVDAKWKRWKRERLGSEDTIVHEPDIRRRNRPFYGPAGESAVNALPDILSDLDFTGVAVVVHRDDYTTLVGSGPLDESLPAHAYMMALDFLMERIVLALDAHFDGARATVVAESRGYKEDAELQYEFARLHLDGTSYIAANWFRQQLHPGIRFQSKTDNVTGLQLADLMARPIGEKVVDPSSDPPRWDVFREKLCAGQETKNSILGLKILPWGDQYTGLWKS